MRLGLDPMTKFKLQVGYYYKSAEIYIKNVYKQFKKNINPFFKDIQKTIQSFKNDYSYKNSGSRTNLIYLKKIINPLKKNNNNSNIIGKIYNKIVKN